MEEEHRNLCQALAEGTLLGQTNDKLVQDYSAIAGRLIQLSNILTLDAESLLREIT